MLLDAYRISIVTDRAFILELEAAGQIRSQRIPAGRWVVEIDNVPVVSGFGRAPALNPGSAKEQQQSSVTP